MSAPTLRQVLNNLDLLVSRVEWWERVAVEFGVETPGGLAALERAAVARAAVVAAFAEAGQATP